MSGASPGRGHPGRGNSPAKAPAPRPTLGSNSQTSQPVDENPKVLLKKMNVSGHVVSGPSQGVSSSSAAKSQEVKKVTTEKKEAAVSKSVMNPPTSVNVQRPEGRGQQTVQVKTPLQPAGVQPSPSPCRQRRTSLERQTIQQNLQQNVLLTSDRTRSGSSKKDAKSVDETKAGRSQGAATAKNLGAGLQPGDCAPTAVTAAAAGPKPQVSSPAVQRPGLDTSGTSTTPVRGHPVSPQPAVPSNGHSARGGERAPELSLAEKIPALVRRMETLKREKLQLQKQIDCMYKLKAANPDRHELHDRKLSSLAIQLADTVREMDSVIEQLGPVGETYRNQQRFESELFQDGARQSHGKPLLQPASFSFKEGSLYKGEASAQQQQAPPARTGG